VACRVRRLEPLGHEHTRGGLHGSQRRRDAVESAPHPGGELLGLALRTELRPESDDLLGDSVERRGREVEHLDVERPGADGAVHLVGGDRAHVAELLHDDDVGLDLGPRLLLDGVQGVAVAGGLGDHAVDLAALEVARLDERRCHDGALGRLRRPVALVRDADHAIAQAEREQHLGRRRDERADLHSGQPSGAG
jgi:hypothetical protein